MNSKFSIPPPGPPYLPPFESRLCQGKTESGLDFQTFSGNDFDKVIEKEFREWALGVFGGTFP